MKRTATPRPVPTPPATLGITAAAEYLGISRDTCRRLIASGDLPAHRVGPRLIKVYVTDLDELRRPVPTTVGGRHG